MNFNKTFLLCLSFMFTFNLHASTLEKGWNLVSFPYIMDSNISTIMDDNIKTIWAYKQDKWSAYSSDTQYNQLLLDNNISLLTKLDASQGIWVEALKDFTPSFPVLSLYTNDINISKGWNLLGTIEDKTSLSQIDANATYWKYHSGEWLLGDNLSSENFKKFNTITKDEGFWIFSAFAHTYKEDLNKKVLFLDQNLIPQNISYDNKEVGLNGFLNIKPYISKIDINDSNFKTINNLYLDNTQRNFAIFLYNNRNTVLGSAEQNSLSALTVTDFTLPNYFTNFYHIVSFPIEAKVIKPVILSQNVAITISNLAMKKSLTISLDEINTAPQDIPTGKFIRGFNMKVLDSKKQELSLESLDGIALLKPRFTNIAEAQNLFIYAKSTTGWDFVGPAEQTTSTNAISKNWWSHFTSFVLLDVNDSAIYTKKANILNSEGASLRDVIIVSNNKITAVTDINGTFTYTAPEKPTELIAYKQGYEPQKIDINSSKTILLQHSSPTPNIAGIKIKRGKDFKLLYYTGNNKVQFTYASTDYTLKPILLADTGMNIYASIYKFGGHYAFAASNSTVATIQEDGTIAVLREGDGLIFDTFLLNNDSLYYGTFGDAFAKINTDGAIAVDEALSEYDFLDFPLATVYKPLITDNKIYIPLYNPSQTTNASLYIKGTQNPDTNNLNLLSSLGTPGKLSQTQDKIVFGTSKSKIIFIDKTSNALSQTVDFNGTGIIAKILSLDGNYFAIDTNGTIKKFDSSLELISTVSLSPASNLQLNNGNLLIAAQNGNLYTLDTNLNLINTVHLDSAIIAEPLIYNNTLYTITKNGSFYKDSIKIGSFNTKVSNIELIESSIIFGAENGSIWKIDI